MEKSTEWINIFLVGETLWNVVPICIRQEQWEKICKHKIYIELKDMQDPTPEDHKMEYSKWPKCFIWRKYVR